MRSRGTTYAYTDANWGDLLTAYDGVTITHDEIGNPLSYYNGTRWTFTWEDGRQLATATDGTTSISYTYDADGIRTSKTVNGVKHTYVYASGKLLRETYGDTIIDFFYSTSGQPYALNYNGTVYYYITNLQGDVMSIVNASGAVVVNYKYDPYGNILSITGTLSDTLGEVNPLRYRGYVYDQECNLYYLQSRYYDPSIGRFLNADAYTSTGQGIVGNNMFAYCLNNPVNYLDSTGELAFPGEIHNEVVKRIAIIYGFYSEEKIQYAFGYGRADLISPDGQVWDVKRDKPRHIKAGKKQVQKYVDNVWKRHPDIPLSVGGSEIMSGTFNYKSGLTTYRVTYKYVGDGVIAYDYAIVDFDYQTVAQAALVVCLGMATGAIAGMLSGSELVSAQHARK